MFCDDCTYFTLGVNVALALPSLTLYGKTGGEHCSGSPIKLTACKWNLAFV
jgi:hypothetical protein